MNGLDVVSTILRSVHVGALTSVFGNLVLFALVARTLPATPATRVQLPRLHTRLGQLHWGSMLLALASGAAWFEARTAVISGAHDWHETLDAIIPVALETQFGQLILARFALLVALLPLGSALWAPQAGAARQHFLLLPAAIVLAGAALGLQAATSHAGAMSGVAGRSLMAAEVLHVLAAGAWLGALAPLLIVLAIMPPEAAAVAVKRFFPLGLVSVLVMAATSLLQAMELVGSVPALVGTAYGRVALLKLVLFLALLAFAALNRFMFGAKLGVRLQRSIVSEAAVAVLVLLAAGLLAHLTPGVHEQPVWPFPWRISPRMPGRLVAAYPTSFFVSPTGFDAAAIVRGKLRYEADCAACHGATAQGNGPASRALPVAPADVTTERVLGYSDGDLFWFVGHLGGVADDDRWDLVDYLRARNRGEFVRTAGRGLHPLRLPRFSAVCADGHALDPDDLRGRVLRIRVPAAGTARFLPAQSNMQVSAGVAAITLPADAVFYPDMAACAVQPEAREAFAILLGTTPDALAGSEFLVDPNGWLRARWRPGEPGGWATPELLLARVQALASHPLPADVANGRAHQH